MIEQTQFSQDIRFCLSQLKDFIACSPAGKRQAVNWEEVRQRKEVAQRSLDRLESLFDSPVDLNFEDICERLAYPRF